MGMRNHTSCEETGSGVSLKDLMNLLRDRIHDDSNHSITLDFDVNLIAISKCGSCNSTKAIVEKLISIMKVFAVCGYAWALTVDPEHRHFTKRESACRRARKIFNSIEPSSDRHELTQDVQRLNDASGEAHSASELQKEREYLSRLANKKSMMSVS